MDKKLRNTIIFGIIIVAISIGYYFVIRPSQKTEFETCYQQCVKNGMNQNQCVINCGKHFGGAY